MHSDIILHPQGWTLNSLRGLSDNPLHFHGNLNRNLVQSEFSQQRIILETVMMEKIISEGCFDPFTLSCAKFNYTVKLLCTPIPKGAYRSIH